MKVTTRTIPPRMQHRKTPTRAAAMTQLRPNHQWPPEKIQTVQRQTVQNSPDQTMQKQPARSPPQKTTRPQKTATPPGAGQEPLSME
ncbi:hypothetical protein ACMYR2_0968 [Nitrobacter sp. TKz-YC01]